MGLASLDAQASACTSSRQNICAAYERKKTKYQDLTQAIAERPCDLGWSVQVLLWVVRFRGVLDATSILQAMAFLEPPASKR
jgi:hypothetical protein